MASSVHCVLCKEPIEKRSDLIVAGKSISAFHRSCFESGRGNVLVWSSGPPLNGNAFYVGLVCLAALWFGLPALIDKVDPAELHLLLGFLGVVLIGSRLLSWFTVEARIPAD